MWRDYQSIYLRFSLNLNIIFLINRLNAIYFEGYPLNLPRNIMLSTLDHLLPNLQNISNRKGLSNISQLDIPLLDEIKNNVELNENEDDENNEDIAVIVTNIETLRQLLDEPRRESNNDYKKYMNYQEFLMCYSLFEGFIIESVKYACIKKPQIMPKGFTIDMSLLLDNDNYDELLRSAISNFAFKECYGSLKDKIINLNKLKISNIDKNDIKKLMKMDIIRNIITHNGGKITSLYLKKVNNHKNIDSELCLDDDELDDYINLIEVISYDLYSYILKNIYNLNNEFEPIFDGNKFIH